jgi:hypothetical protein
VQLLPDKNNNPALLARISFKDNDKETIKKQAERDAPLFEAITKRRSNRSSFENRRLPDDLLVSLKDNPDANGAWLDGIDNEDKKNNHCASMAVRSLSAGVVSGSPLLQL